ncbi:MAG TPA: hypothetical protein VGL38_04565 [bacterium]|jgi:uncharacterized membrane protein HdeD (DUF308 family)
MQVFSQWVLPIAMIAIGIAILTGVLIPTLPAGSSLRFMFGLVAILLGVLRFVSSRSQRRGPPDDRRRFGGPRKFPWENR